MRSVMLRSISLVKVLTAVFGLGLGCGSISVASTPACTKEMSILAGSSLFAASQSWRSLYKHQETFIGCDDGSIAEGYTEAVVHLFAQEWGQVNVFFSIANQDQYFAEWAMRHIDASASPVDLKNVVVNADACSKNYKEEQLCKEMKRAAENALDLASEVKGRIY